MTGCKFVTAINCIDGRVQELVYNWLKTSYEADYVDMITEPGPDKVLSEGPLEIIESIKRKVAISVDCHCSHVIAIIGHYDCAANPVIREDHCIQIVKSVEIVKTWGFPAQVLGLWINENWEIEVLNCELEEVASEEDQQIAI
jgi:hypothetical protein